MVVNRFLYCAKNILQQETCEDSSAIFCGGPNGEGVEDSCLTDCSHAYTDRKSLANGIGNVVLNRQGI